MVEDESALINLVTDFYAEVNDLLICTVWILLLSQRMQIPAVSQESLQTQTPSRQKILFIHEGINTFRSQYLQSRYKWIISLIIFWKKTPEYSV